VQMRMTGAAKIIPAQLIVHNEKDVSDSHLLIRISRFGAGKFVFVTAIP